VNDSRRTEIDSLAYQLGTLLRYKRQYAGLSHQDIALAVGGTYGTTVVNWEHGRGLLRVAQFIRALEACGVEVRVRTTGPGEQISTSGRQTAV